MNCVLENLSDFPTVAGLTQALTFGLPIFSRNTGKMRYNNKPRNPKSLKTPTPYEPWEQGSEAKEYTRLDHL